MRSILDTRPHHKQTLGLIQQSGSQAGTGCSLQKTGYLTWPPPCANSQESRAQG